MTKYQYRQEVTPQVIGEHEKNHKFLDNANKIHALQSMNDV